MRAFAIAAAFLCFACFAFADEAVIAAFKARIEKSGRLDTVQKDILVARTKARLGSRDLGPDRRNHAAQVADKLVSGVFEGRLVLTTAERFPTAADAFEVWLTRFVAWEPFTDQEREMTAANWNAAAKGADIVIDSAMGELPAGLRARIKEAVAAKLLRSPKDFGLYFGQGVWRGDALTAEAAAKEIAADPSFEVIMHSHFTSMKALLSNASSSTELASSAERTAVFMSTNTVESAFNDLMRKYLDTSDRWNTAVEVPSGLEERIRKMEREAAEEADREDQARQPAAVPAEPPKQPVKDAGGVPKPAIDG